ncbi:MAG: YgjV family protein [Oscillospiraceae bacterium]|nr:YgjV family protein [Oscillospiraceae bacterium]MBQ3224630.1 YgjV family protein [Oscillospiraceae bacterium]
MAEIISYIASGISIVLGLCEPFGKTMKSVLIFNFLGNLLVGLSYLLVNTLNGAAICAVACVQVVINYIFDMKRKKAPNWLIAIYALAFLAVNLLSFACWYDVIALAAAMCFVLSVAQPDPKYYRLFFITNSSLWIIYDALAKAHGNLITHTALFIATFIAICVRDEKKKSERNNG